MPLDPSIYGMIQQPKVATPFENTQQALTIKALMEQDRMRPQMQQMAMQKQQGELAQQRATTSNTQAEAQSRNLKVSRDMLASATSQADVDVLKEHIARTFGPQAAAQVPNFDDPRFQTERAQKIMDADSLLKRISPELQSVDTGGQVQRVNPYTNQVMGTMQKTMTPDQVKKVDVAKSKKGGLPTPALKLQQEELEAIGLGSTIASDLSQIRSQVDTGSLNLGPIENLMSKAKNLVGKSDENSRNFATFQSTLEKLRNDSLRLNKGVQTEGDAQRAWNEILTNINDKELVKKRLEEVEKINERAVNLRKMNVDTIRSNYNADPLDTSEYTTQPSAIVPGSSGTASSPSPKSFNSMPDPSQFSGKRIRSDDGVVYRSNGKSWVKE